MSKLLSSRLQSRIAYRAQYITEAHTKWSVAADQLRALKSFYKSLGHEAEVSTKVKFDVELKRKLVQHLHQDQQLDKQLLKQAYYVESLRGALIDVLIT